MLAPELVIGEEREDRNCELNEHATKGHNHHPDEQVDVDHDAKGGQGLGDEGDAKDSQRTKVLNLVKELVVVGVAGT